MAFLRSILLFCVLLIAAAANAAQPPRLVAIGDLHGDHAAFFDIARAAALIDDDGRWIGGSTTLVQLGDVTDRGPDSLKIIRDLQRLERQAEEAGGDVIALIGNHEAMNVIGDLRYVHPGEYAAFADRKSKDRRKAFWRSNEDAFLAAMEERFPDGNERQWRAKWEEEHPLGWVEHRIAWQPGGELAQYYASKPAIVKIDDMVFVHGGISAATAGQGIEASNAAIAAALEAPTPMGPLEAPGGPLWYRGNHPEMAGERTPEMVRAELDAALQALDAKRLIVAHTPQLGGIDVQHDGRLVRIDTGIAAYYSGTPSYLEIIDGHAYAVDRDENGRWQRRLLPEPGGNP